MSDGDNTPQPDSFIDILKGATGRRGVAETIRFFNLSTVKIEFRVGPLESEKLKTG